MPCAERIQTKFQSIEVWKSNGATEFRVAGALHAWFHPTRFLTGLAWDLITAAALLRPDAAPKSILMLGLAGGTALRTLRHLLPECQLTAIDIDSEIIDLARKHMHLDELDLEIITADAYAWLEKNDRQFDVVFDDIYLAGETDVFRPRAWDTDLLFHLQRAVSPGGLLAVNLVTGEGHRTMQSLMRKILRNAFPQVRSLKTIEGMNEVLVAGESVATRPRLDTYSPAFTRGRDSQYWDRITLRRI